MIEPGFPDRAVALFFDFDGTLVDLAPQPEAVQVHDDVPHQLALLGAAVGGALAVVSGRTVADIDSRLAPLKLCVAGVHGAERRGADGYIRRVAVGALNEAAAIIDTFCRQRPGVRMETKPGAIALHYRQAPELEDECLATMTRALERVEGMTLLRGKMVVEMKPRRAGKGLAVGSFLDERPFRQRRPWYFGDDVTDEAAFEVVQAMGGVAVKVGDGETLAAHRLPDPAAVRRWMAEAVNRFATASPVRVAT